MLLRLLLLNRPPTFEEVLFALLSFGMAVVSAVAAVVVWFSRLELTPEGFRVRNLWNRMYRWIDVEDIRPTEVSISSWARQRYVAFSLTPAARARARPGLRRFLGAGRLTIMPLGMSNQEQAALMERWRERWTTGPFSS